MTDEELIAKAIAEGKVRKIPCGETSDWDQLPFRKRMSLSFKGVNKAKKMLSRMADGTKRSAST